MDLPAELSSFVGRAELLAAAADAMRRGRLVTLTGPGGVGKTRLALRVAAEVAHRWDDDPVLVELTGVAPDDVPTAVARQMDIPLSAGESDATTTGRLVDHLRGGARLIVLDNVEHAAGRVATLVLDLVRALPRLTVLVTSRVRLGVPGEHVITVPPMPTTAPEGETPEALRLLLDRADAIAPIPPGRREAAGRLVDLLDGHPLAIELVSAWLAVISVEEALHGLDGLLMADIGHVTDLPHHRSLRAAMDWTHDLLSHDARLMWALAAQFHGGFRLEAVRAVAEAIGVDGVVGALAQLVNHSVLTREDRDGGSRYRMLEPVRQYGATLTPDGLDRPRVRAAHADHYLRVAARAARDWYGPEEVWLIRELADDLPNVLVASAHFDRPGEVRGLRMAIDLIRARVFHFTGAMADARSLLRTGIANHPPEPSGTLADGLATLALLCLIQGRVEDARAALARHARVVEALGAASLAGQFTTATWTWLTEDDLSRGLAAAWMLDEVAQRAHQLGAEADARAARTMALFAEVFSVDATGYPRAAERVDALVEEATRSGARWYLSWLLGGRAVLEHRLGSQTAAVQALRSAIDIQLDVGDEWGLAWSLWLSAALASAVGEHRCAARLVGGAGRRLRGLDAHPTDLRPFRRLRADAEAVTRHALGSEYDTEVAAGEALPYTDVVGLAVDLAGRTLVEGRPGGLTKREYEVAEWVSRGVTNREIATELALSVRTVEWYVSKAMEKTGARGRVGLSRWFMGMTHPFEADTAGQPGGQR